MTTLRLAEEVFTRDLVRIEQHRAVHDVERIGERLEAIFEAM